MGTNRNPRGWCILWKNKHEIDDCTATHYAKEAQLKFLPEMLAIFTLSRCLIRTMTDEAIKNFLFGWYQEIVVFLSTPSGQIGRDFWPFNLPVCQTDRNAHAGNTIYHEMVITEPTTVKELFFRSSSIGWRTFFVKYRMLYPPIMFVWGFMLLILLFIIIIIIIPLLRLESPIKLKTKIEWIMIRLLEDTIASDSQKYDGGYCQQGGSDSRIKPPLLWCGAFRITRIISLHFHLWWRSLSLVSAEVDWDNHPNWRQFNYIIIFGHDKEASAQTDKKKIKVIDPDSETSRGS